MEIDITELFARLQTRARFCSGSIAELGEDAGRITWTNSRREAQQTPVLQTREELLAFAAFVRASGFAPTREDLKIENLRALFVQWVAGDMREGGQASGSIYLGDNGRVYFYAGT